jgi:hypothetical protein
MADLLIEKDKKTEWLQKYGTPNALELLGIQVDELSQKAVQSRMLSKEKQDMNGTTDMIDPLDNLTEAQTTRTADGFDDLSGLADDLVQNKELQTQVETPVAEVETEETPVEVVKETVNNEDSGENRELIDTLIVEIVNPMIEELKEVRKEIQAVRDENATNIAAREALQKQVDTLQKELQVQGLQIKEETLPQASTAALLKSYIKEQLSQDKADSGTFGKSVSVSDPILAKKPAENKAKGYEQNGVFAGFIDGN